MNKFFNSTENKIKSYMLLAFLGISFIPGFSQQSYTFTTAGATGQVGPTQGLVNTAYALTNLNGSVTVLGNGVQQWSVPLTGMYRIQAIGASGGSINVNCSAAGGLGANMSGDYSLTSGQVLLILVGQKGTTNGSDAGGGGGSFVTSSASVAMVVAGGGGGASNNIGSCGTNLNGVNGSITTTATAGTSGGGTGGTLGNGGVLAGGGSGGAGGGLLTNGSGGGQPGLAFVNGANGGTGLNVDHGGYGGGGTGWFTGGNGGGGGGYSGGGSSGTQAYAGGGGGGSFNSGVNQTNGLAVGPGDGLVIITALCNITVTNTSSNPICIGNSATLTTNAISNYAWSNGGNASSIVVSPTVTTSYTLTATSPSNCTASAAITVTVNNTPTVSAVISSSVICLNKTVVMTAVGANTYTWTGGATNGAPFTPTATSDFTVTGTNACGISTAVVSVTVNPLPNVTASVNNPTVCNGSNIILNGGGSVSGYTWNPAAPNNVAFAPPATTNYVVTGAGANGCTNTAVAGVTVLVTPTITPIVTPTAVCFGVTATLSAIGATGYTWTPGTNLTAATLTVSPPATTTYTLFRTNGACSSTSTVNLVINPLPLVNASATPSQICAGTGINLLVFGAITYTWLPGGFTISNFTVYPNFSTNYTVTGSNGNCTTTVVVPVIVNPTPTISISSSTTTICQGNNLTLTASGGLTYTWQPGNSNLGSVVVSPNTTTIITVSATNSLGCIASQNQLILVNPLPDMTLTSSIPYICVGQTAVLSIANPTTNVVYNWSNGAFGTSISPNPSVTTNYFSTGTNTITGCTNTNTITLSVYIATFVVTSPTAICNGATATLTASGPATSYSWTASGGVISPSVTVSPVLTTVYYVTGSNVSCSNTQSVSVIVNPIPNVTALTAKSTICRFEVSTITGSGATTYSWNTGASTPTISFTLSLTTTYTLTGTDVNSCARTITVTQFVATCIGIEDHSANPNIGLNVYPNPNNGNFIISSDVNITLSILNSIGQVVSTVKISQDDKKEIAVNNLPNGIYFITGQVDGLKVNKKIIVER